VKARRNRAMKVLFLPDGSRGNPYQLELAEALRRRGVNVTLSNGIGSLPILGAIWIHGKPDILHLHWTHGFVVGSTCVKTFLKALRFLTELVLARLIGVRVVWTVHNLLQHERKHSGLELFFNRILVWLYDQLIVHCDAAIEELMRSYRLPGRFRHKIKVIPHGNYVSSYPNQVSREEARGRFGLAMDELVFLYLGQIRPYKGVPELIDAFLKVDHPDARLLIAGRPATEEVKAQIREWSERDDRIQAFLEFIPDTDIQLYMNAADVVVLPYRDILTSGAALLAMSFGKPIIAPRLGCLAEVIDEGAGGFLYDPDDGGGLLQAMQQAVSADLSVMGQYNFQRAQEFDWSKIAEMTLEVYRRCVKRRSNLGRKGAAR